MAGQGGFVTRLNGTENFNVAGNTNASATTSLSSFIGEVTSINLPEIGVTDIDVSSFDSASNYMEFVSGSKDPGLIDIELNYDKAEDALLLAAMGEANEVWQISFPDDSIWKSVGYIDKMGGGTTAPNDKISRVASIKLTGVPTQSTSFIAPAAPTP
jgi:hypothetical protein